MAKPTIPPVTATISAGQSVSPSIDLTAGSVAYVIAPSDWPPDAPISFAVSVDNTNFYDLFDNQGFELTRPLVANVAVAVSTVLTQAALYFKIRSGTRVAPVVHDTDQVFTLILM